jgi:hypothetical protein
MTPELFLKDVVEPNLSAFVAEDDDIRLAFNAVASVDALAAHVFWWGKDYAPAAVAGIKQDTDYRETLATLNSDFRLLRDIAKAQKHVRLERGNPEVKEAANVSSRAVGFGEGPWSHGKWGGPPQVVVDTDAGEMRYVSQLVRAGLTFLEGELSRVRAAAGPLIRQAS